MMAFPIHEIETPVNGLHTTLYLKFYRVDHWIWRNWAMLYKKQMGDVLHHIFLDFFLDYQRSS